jgi:Tfp pilus assembly protein PilE
VVPLRIFLVFLFKNLILNDKIIKPTYEQAVVRQKRTDHHSFLVDISTITNNPYNHEAVQRHGQAIAPGVVADAQNTAHIFP